MDPDVFSCYLEWLYCGEAQFYERSRDVAGLARDYQTNEGHMFAQYELVSACYDRVLEWPSSHTSMRNSGA